MRSASGAGLLASLFCAATHRYIYPSSTVAAAAVVGQYNQERSLEKVSEVDVIVVGGGYSGLTAASELSQAGLSTVVLEARNRIGGRFWSYELDSGPGLVELGATWINNVTQPAVWKLTQKFGLETIVQYVEGDTVWQFPDGTVARIPMSLFTGEGGDEETGTSEGESDEGAAVLESIVEFVTLLEEAADAVDIREWEQFPEQQDVFLDEWLEQQGLWENPIVQAYASQLASALVGREPRELGAHYFLDYIKSGLGIGSLGSETAEGAQFLFYKDGSTALCTELAKTLPEGSVLTNSPVAKIKQNDKCVMVTTESGQVFKGKKVVMANPTNTYKDIEFSPALPEGKKTVTDSTMGGVYTKVLVSYSTAGWRAAGLQGKFTSMSGGPVRFGWEMSVPELSQFTLALFVSGDVAAEWHELSVEEQRAGILDHLAELVGEELADKAHDVLEYNFVEWTKEEYLWGGPTSSMPADMLRKYGRELREPFENLHFAGGETAFEWKGYLEGAVTAGQRAAEEVVAALGGDRN